MRVWVVACLLALTAMAGCIGEKESQPIDSTGECPDPAAADESMAATSEPAEDDGETGNESNVPGFRQAANESEPDTENAGEEEHQADSDCPEMVIGGSGAGVIVVATPAEGSVPFDVVFEMEAFEVPLDENLTWTLDVDGDGVNDTEGNGNHLPGNFTFTYTVEGTYNVTFTATDGLDVWDNTTVVLALPGEEEEEQEEEIDDGEPAPEPFGGIEEGIFVAATCGVACTFGGADTACVGFSQLHQNGVDCAWIEIPESAWGQKFTVNSDWVEEDPDAAAFTSCDAAEATEIETYGAGGGEAGVIPPGTGCLIGWEFTGPASTIYFVVESAI